MSLNPSTSRLFMFSSLSPHSSSNTPFLKRAHLKAPSGASALSKSQTQYYTKLWRVLLSLKDRTHKCSRVAVDAARMLNPNRLERSNGCLTDVDLPNSNGRAYFFAARRRLSQFVPNALLTL